MAVKLQKSETFNKTMIFRHEGIQTKVNQRALLHDKFAKSTSRSSAGRKRVEKALMPA